MPQRGNGSDSSEAASARPVTPRAGSRDSTLVIHDAVRDAILTAEMPPGTWVTQLGLAKRFGVSRGPVREALRLLEQEGLIESAVNQRARVAAFSIDDLEELYGVRIVTEALAISVTVPRLSADDIQGLSVALDQLDDMAGTDIPAWEALHRHFHGELVKFAGKRVRRTLDQYYDHAERYRRMYISGYPRAFAVGAAEHRQILGACAAADAHLAASLLARHLSRTALTALALIAPEHEPAMIRAAVRQVTSGLDPAALAMPPAQR
jgi:DNA-binding GntR family transcriptional regulator